MTPRAEWLAPEWHLVDMDEVLARSLTAAIGASPAPLPVAPESALVSAAVPLLREMAVAGGVAGGKRRTP